ncbi:MAG: hypothetical protein L3K14_01510 [Thermoplasmata archaeon]|nr:hypothetical protein [Thermoplasmata archaeon]
MSAIAQVKAPVGQAPGGRETTSPVQALGETVAQRLFPGHLELVPGLNEVYELELALCESRILTDSEIVRHGAYFASVGETPTNHYLMCRGEPLRVADHSSSRLRSFFQENQFKTGYGTHGLFPYRGKFHPQMTKALLNIMGLKPGETVLDPMMGSGTVLIEARLMGIHSTGVDASPFCVFMAKVKSEAITLSLAPLRAALEASEQVFQFFSSRSPDDGGSKSPATATGNVSDLRKWSDEPGGRPRKEHWTVVDLPDGLEAGPVRDFLLLAYLDSAGYAERSQRKSHLVQFKSILERYVFSVEKIQRVLSGVEGDLGTTTPTLGDARKLRMHDECVDGILFSPPYSFALDYVSNDALHLRYLGIDVDELRSNMVGLIGQTPRERVENYRRDMESVLGECNRVLRAGRLCTIVVGTNNNQIGKALDLPPEKVQGTDEFLTEAGQRQGLKLVRTFTRQITGMANTMRTESILVFQKIPDA